MVSVRSTSYLSNSPSTFTSTKFSEASARRNSSRSRAPEPFESTLAKNCSSLRCCAPGVSTSAQHHASLLHTGFSKTPHTHPQTWRARTSKARDRAIHDAARPYARQQTGEPTNSGCVRAQDSRPANGLPPSTAQTANCLLFALACQSQSTCPGAREGKPRAFPHCATTTFCLDSSMRPLPRVLELSAALKHSAGGPSRRAARQRRAGPVRPRAPSLRLPSLSKSHCSVWLSFTHPLAARNVRCSGQRRRPDERRRGSGQAVHCSSSATRMLAHTRTLTPDSLLCSSSYRLSMCPQTRLSTCANGKWTFRQARSSSA